jgi:hypothetical protein
MLAVVNYFLAAIVGLIGTVHGMFVRGTAVGTRPTRASHDVQSVVATR